MLGRVRQGPVRLELENEYLSPEATACLMKDEGEQRRQVPVGVEAGEAMHAGDVEDG
jgi:hypothetical protein